MSTHSYLCSTPKKGLLNDSTTSGSLRECFLLGIKADLPSKLSRHFIFILSKYVKAHKVGRGSPREASCLVQKLGSQVNLILQGEPGSVLQFVSSNRCIWNTICQKHRSHFFFGILLQNDNSLSLTLWTGWRAQSHGSLDSGILPYACFLEP